MPLIFGLIMLMWSGTPAISFWPLCLSHAWVPLCVPAIYAAASAVWGQPAGRFLQVSLLNTYVILQVRTEKEAL